MFNIDMMELQRIFIPATQQTLYMVAFSGFFAIIIGTIIGVGLYITAKDGLCGNAPPVRLINIVLGMIVNIGRSVPFVILIIAAIPLTRLVMGAFIGTEAAAFSLTLAAIPFVARLTEATFNDLNKGVVEASIVCGATAFQTVRKVLLPETIHRLILDYTVAIVNLVAFSAMAGIIGGGGLGDVAIRHGLHNFRTDILVWTVLILIVLVQLVQLAGNILSRVFDKR